MMVDCLNSPVWILLFLIHSFCSLSPRPHIFRAVSIRAISPVLLSSMTYILYISCTIFASSSWIASLFPCQSETFLYPNGAEFQKTRNHCMDFEILPSLVLSVITARSISLIAPKSVSTSLPVWEERSIFSFLDTKFILCCFRNSMNSKR